MNIPYSIKNTLSSSATIMLAPLGIPQDRINAAISAFFAELDGDGGFHSFTKQVPIDRVVKRNVVADILGVSKFTVSKMVKAGKLRAVYGGKDGKRLTGIIESSIRAFMEQGKAVA